MGVTIGIPFYNAGDYLADSIRSVFAQTYKDWELILLDDGSTDQSLEIARSVRDPRVRVFSDGRNLKLAARLNQITQMANFGLIARMDADDLMAPDRIQAQVQVLREQSEIDLVSTGLISVDSNDSPIGARWHISDTVDRGQLLWRRGCGIVHASVLGRREWFLRNQYNPAMAIAQDYELWLRASRADDLKVRTLRQPLYYVRELASASPEKVLRSYRADRLSIWMHRKSVLELAVIGKSITKSLALKAIVRAGRFDAVVKRRSMPIQDPEIVAKFKGDLDRIRATQVPGL